MLIRIYAALILLCLCLAKNFVIIPYNSIICQNYSQGVHQYHEFIISHQINLNTNANISNVVNILQSPNYNNTRSLSYPSWPLIDSDVYYFCRILVKPMGRRIDFKDHQGISTFWNVRIQVDRIPGKIKCSDKLLLQFRHDDNHVTTLESPSIQTINITCHNFVPIIVSSMFRKLYITYFSNDSSSSGYVVNVTSFISFQGSYSLAHQQDRCRRQDGFWCVNSTVCIYREMRCDGLDSCYDGGSDELDCEYNTNFTIIINRDKKGKTSSRFIDYLPWLALGILPLILLLALVCICNQHRSEVYFDDDEDNLDVEKSHDDNMDDLWNSCQDLDKANGDIADEHCFCRSEDDGVQWVAGKSANGGDSVIGLMSLPQQGPKLATVSEDPSPQASDKNMEHICQILSESNNGKCPSVNIENRSKYSENIMCASQCTDEDYEDQLEDVGSLLRKVDKSHMIDEVGSSATHSTFTQDPLEGSDVVRESLVTDTGTSETTNQSNQDGTLEYQSDYILV